ncbi:hypothetical protein [Egbenema bharatensis]|uniref:hypothetical protein n=1 Tax=Egbenema bharatensis TaxID=3463334 RepID=UPI003A86D09D
MSRLERCRIQLQEQAIRNGLTHLFRRYFTGEMLLQEVDRALYRAKAAGRNQIQRGCDRANPKSQP